MTFAGVKSRPLAGLNLQRSDTEIEMTSGRSLQMQNQRIDFLYTNVGRGHPFYLDGIIGCLPRDRVGTVTDVFAQTTGIAHGAWRLARHIYESAGGAGPYSSLYNRMRRRSDYNRGGLLLSTMGRPLRKLHLGDPNPLVVAHPILAATLRDKANLVYQHGEVAAPRESWVRGRHRVLVPLSSTADAFIAAGLPARSLFVSGLCIEPALVARAGPAWRARLDRIASSDRLCGAFFSSGAEPQEHVESLSAAAVSAAAGGGRVIVFARRLGRLAARVVKRFEQRDYHLRDLETFDELPGRDCGHLICVYDDRRQLDGLTAGLFDRFDYFVAPSHERTNWALGLGLPMFIVGPPLGSFAPLNREFLLAASVAEKLGSPTEASGFGGRVLELRATGGLLEMAEAGWGRFDIRGFFNIAEFLTTLLER
jgi:hypothetical protein